jgi:hypothetical protein
MVNYINTRQRQTKGWPLLGQEDTTSLPANDPKAARSPKLPCWTARVKRIGAHDV